MIQFNNIYLTNSAYTGGGPSFTPKISEIWGIFDDIGTGGDMKTEIKFFVRKIKTRKRSEWRHNFKNL